MRVLPMKKFLLLFILLLVSTLSYAQLTNTSYYQWYSSYGTKFSNQTSLNTNFYKFLVTYNSFYMDLNIGRVNNVNNVFPGTTLNLTHYIYNVGNIPEANGINLKTGNVPAGITVNLLTNTSLVTNTRPITSGGSLSYLAQVTIPTNYTGTTFTFYITNTGSTNGPPYPHKVIVEHTVNVVYQNVLVREATDDIHTITIFDGTQRLGNMNVKVYFQFQNPVSDESSVKLYYDMNGTPDGSTPDGSLTHNRRVTCSKLGNEWVAIIPVTDLEVREGNIVNFIIEADGRLNDNNGIPWRYLIKEYAEQEESDHTISLNNKFDPSAGGTYYLIYTLNRSSFVNISVYNTRGEMIKQLKNEVQQAGKQTIEWDGRNSSGRIVAIGLYLINIQTSEYSDTRKIVVTKR